MRLRSRGVVLGAFSLASAVALAGASTNNRMASPGDSEKAPVAAVAALVRAQDHSKHPAPAIDGVITPELIPNDIAYRLFLNSLKPAQRLPQRARAILVRKAFVNEPCGVLGATLDANRLDEAVEQQVQRASAAVLSNADKYHSEMAMLEADRTNVAGSAARTLLVSVTTESLLNSLEPEAVAALQCYMDRVVKARTRYFDRLVPWDRLAGHNIH